MKKLKKILLSIFCIMLSLIGALVAIFFLYCNSLSNVNPLTISYYNQLKKALGNQGYQNRLIVISSKRVPWHNQLLTLFGASSKSRHLTGDAIDIMVWDVNDDGEIDSNDVDIVYNTLDEKILKNTGGLGTYKTESGIWNTQMVHLDCRQKRTRWNR